MERIGWLLVLECEVVMVGGWLIQYRRNGC